MPQVMFVVIKISILVINGRFNPLTSLSFCCVKNGADILLELYVPAIQTLNFHSNCVNDGIPSTIETNAERYNFLCDAVSLGIMRVIDSKYRSRSKCILDMFGYDATRAVWDGYGRWQDWIGLGDDWDRFISSDPAILVSCPVSLPASDSCFAKDAPMFDIILENNNSRACWSWRVWA